MGSRQSPACWIILGPRAIDRERSPHKRRRRWQECEKDRACQPRPTRSTSPASPAARPSSKWAHPTGTATFPSVQSRAQTASSQWFAWGDISRLHRGDQCEPGERSSESTRMVNDSTETGSGEPEVVPNFRRYHQKQRSKSHQPPQQVNCNVRSSHVSHHETAP